MKIISQYENIQSLDPYLIEESKEGKWNQWKRIFILKSQDNFAFVSLNFFERLLMKLCFIHLFKDIFGTKNVEIVSPHNLNQEDRKTIENAQPLLIGKKEDIQISQKKIQQVDTPSPVIHETQPVNIVESQKERLPEENSKKEQHLPAQKKEEEPLGRQVPQTAQMQKEISKKEEENKSGPSSQEINQQLVSSTKVQEEVNKVSNEQKPDVQTPEKIEISNTLKIETKAQTSVAKGQICNHSTLPFKIKVTFGQLGNEMEINPQETIQIEELSPFIIPHYFPLQIKQGDKIIENREFFEKNASISLRVKYGKPCAFIKFEEDNSVAAKEPTVTMLQNIIDRLHDNTDILENRQIARSWLDSQGKLKNIGDAIRVFCCYNRDLFQERSMRKEQIINALKFILHIEENNPEFDEIIPDHLYRTTTWDVGDDMFGQRDDRTS